MSLATLSTPSSLACPPRFGTSRDPSCPTHGARVAAFAEQLGKPLMPWQRQVVDTALEVDPATGRLKYRRVILTVPRQSGKTTLLLALFAHRALGFHEPQVMTYAAQTGLDARKKFVDEHVPALERSLLKPLFRVRMTNGQEAVLWKNGSRHHIGASTEKSGHGATLDLAVVDEAFAQPDGRLEQAFSPTMVTRPQPQLWFVSTAGSPSDLWFRRKVEAGRAALDQPGIAYFEWSAPEDADPGDREVWRACMPALGHTISEAVIAAEYLSLPEDEFRRAYLNQWVDKRDTTASALDLEKWSALEDPQPHPGPDPVWGVATAHDHSHSAIAVAWRRPDGRVQVQLSDWKPDRAWVKPRLEALRAKWGGRVVAARTARELAPDADEPNSSVQALADNALADLVDTGGLRHGGEPVFAVAVAGSRWKTTVEPRVLDRKGSVDISPLTAAALAVHAVTAAPTTGGWMVSLP